MSQTTEQIDAVLATLWPGVVAQQDAYFASSGSYYQMLWTHSAPPSEMTAPDNLHARPTDQPGVPVSGLPAAMRSRMRIDTYGQPAGWTMTLQAVVDGALWSRSIDCGVDGARSSAWQEVNAG